MIGFSQHSASYLGPGTYGVATDWHDENCTCGGCGHTPGVSCSCCSSSNPSSFYCSSCGGCSHNGSVRYENSFVEDDLILTTGWYDTGELQCRIYQTEDGWGREGTCVWYNKDGSVKTKQNHKHKTKFKSHHQASSTIEILIKESMKEALALHMLLLKNNSKEVNNFLRMYNYISHSDEENQFYYKSNSDPNYISPFIIIPNNNQEEIESQLTLTFIKNDQLVTDYDIISNIYNTTLKSIQIDCNKADHCTSMLYHLLVSNKVYNALSTASEVTGLTKSTNKITYYVSNEKHVYKASNFQSFNENLIFAGPIDHMIIFNPQEDGTLSISSPFSDKNNYTKSFNFRHFMSLQNLNDVIWNKLKMNNK